MGPGGLHRGSSTSPQPLPRQPACSPGLRLLVPYSSGGTGKGCCPWLAVNGLVGLGTVGEVGVAPDLRALVARWRHNQMMDGAGCGRREADWPASGSRAVGALSCPKLADSPSSGLWVLDGSNHPRQPLCLGELRSGSRPYQ